MSSALSQYTFVNLPAPSLPPLHSLQSSPMEELLLKLQALKEAVHTGKDSL